MIAKSKRRAKPRQPNFAQFHVRKITAKGTPESRLASEKLYHIEAVVKDLVNEHRLISRNNVQRLSRDLPAPIRRVTGADPVHRLVMNDSAPVARRVTSTRAVLSNEITRLSNAAKLSAFEVYGIHLALRLRLGKMIVHRRRTGTQNRLATHLVELRHYNEDLYYRTSVQSTNRIAQKLLDLELRNTFQRTFVLPRVPSTLPLDQRHKKVDAARPAAKHRKLPIRYHRLRKQSTDTSEISNPRRRRTQIVRRHLSKPLPIHRQISYPQARLIRSSASTSRPVSSRPASKRQKADLVESVSSWLGDESDTPSSVKSSPRRLFGSKALSSDEQRSKKEGEGPESVGEVERKQGRVRPFGR